MYPPGEHRLPNLPGVGDLSGARMSVVKIRDGWRDGDHHRGRAPSPVAAGREAADCGGGRWRRFAGRGGPPSRGQPESAVELVSAGAPGFAGSGADADVYAPVQITVDPPVRGQRRLSPAVPGTSQTVASITPERIEIELPDGTRIRVGGDVGLVALRRMVAALRRRLCRRPGCGCGWPMGISTCGVMRSSWLCGARGQESLWHMASLAASLRITSAPAGASQHGHERVGRLELPSPQAGRCQSGEDFQLSAGSARK